MRPPPRRRPPRRSASPFVVGVLAILVLTIALSWWLRAWWPHRHDGQTVAMTWLNLRIVDQWGGPPPSPGRSTIRWLLLVIIDNGLIALIVMLCNPRRQRTGDMAANTLVVRSR